MSRQVRCAAASGALSINGHGSGSGKGLSQWGAYALAAAHRTWRDIVAYYYPGAVPVSTTRTVRVAMDRFGSGAQVVAVKATTRYSVGGSATLAALPSTATQLQVVPTASGPFTLQTRTAATGWANLATGARSPILVRGAPTVDVVSGGTTWPLRGHLRLVSVGTNRLSLVNVTSSEDVTRGTLANVMPSSWPAAALGAQAVAIRSYVVRQVQQTGGATNDDTCGTCVGYTGVRGETTSTTAAQSATAGYVLTNEGVAALTAYTLSNGGMRSTGGYRPFLLPFADSWDRALRVTAAGLSPAMANPADWNVSISVGAVSYT